VAAVEAGVPEVVPNAEGERTTPSAVAFTKDGELLVGQVAKRQAVMNPTSTFQSVKRFVGRQYSEVADEIAAFPYTVLDADGKVKLDCPMVGRHLAPEEVSAHILRKLRDDAASYLNAKVEKAVITVPAYFNDTQRQATKAAGKIAGLEVLRIVNEPTMAALAYGLDQKNMSTVVVLDLGGGTFDVSLLEMGDGVCEVLATAGDAHLGGNDFDKRIVDWLADTFQGDEGVDLRQDKQALQRLVEASESAKIELSSLEEVRISVPFIAAGASGPLHIDTMLTRTKFEELCGDIIKRCQGPLLQALKDAKLKPKDIKEVVMVGGSSRIPAVLGFVRELTAHKPVNSAVNPEEVVAIGAAVQAAMIAGEVQDIMLIDVTPLTLGVETNGGVFSPVVDRNTSIPTKATRFFTTSADAQDAIEVVVLQGERPLAADNKTLGTFRLEGIPPAPAGIPKIEVTFEINLEGILTVSAKDWATRRRQEITLTGVSHLDDEEVDRIMEETEANWLDDELRKDRLELRYSAECLVKQTEENLADLGSKVPEDARQQLMPKLRVLQDAVAAQQETDYTVLKQSVQDMRLELMRLGQRVYGKQLAPDAAPGPAKPRPPGGTSGGGFRASSSAKVDGRGSVAGGGGNLPPDDDEEEEEEEEQ